ncbi:MAG: mycofactocin biosynthesis peptidyl-dipeptidase MftE [Solirubrobacteraceae bacterium]
MRLGFATFPELLGRVDIHLLIPLGATEQHGPHLPLNTDAVIAACVADAVAARRDDVAVAPALPYGSSGEHSGFPGTLSLGQSALEATLIELVRSAAGFRDVTLVSWHGGNAEPVARAVAQLRAERRTVHLWEPHVDGGDAHAGWVETSLMLALAPDLVRDDRPVGATQPIDALLPRLREQGVAAVSQNGVLGDARGAAADVGRALLERFVGEIGSLLDATSNAVSGA